MPTLHPVAAFSRRHRITEHTAELLQMALLSKFGHKDQSAVRRAAVKRFQLGTIAEAICWTRSAANLDDQNFLFEVSKLFSVDADDNGISQLLWPEELEAFLIDCTSRSMSKQHGFGKVRKPIKPTFTHDR